MAATRALGAILAGRNVRCTARDHDHYGCIVAVCKAGGTDVGEAMMRSGRAVAFRRHPHDYVAAEAAARREGLGLWAGRFAAPEGWRRRARRRRVAARHRLHADAAGGRWRAPVPGLCWPEPSGLASLSREARRRADRAPPPAPIAAGRRGG